MSLTFGLLEVRIAYFGIFSYLYTISLHAFGHYTIFTIRVKTRAMVVATNPRSPGYCLQCPRKMFWSQGTDSGARLTYLEAKVWVLVPARKHVTTYSWLRSGEHPRARQKNTSRTRVDM